MYLPAKLLFYNTINDNHACLEEGANVVVITKADLDELTIDDLSFADRRGCQCGTG
jgi:hypothetical protein